MPRRLHSFSANRQQDAFSMVPFQAEAFNPFDNSYSFGSSVQPLFPNTGFGMLSRDDIFQGMRKQMNMIFDGLEHGFRDDTFFNRFRAESVPSWPTMLSSSMNDPNALTHMHTATQTMSYSNINGKPKLIQSHDERELGPGGVWRTRKAHRDTEKHIEKMQEGLFIGDQGEIRERFRNPQTNQLEDRLYHQNVPPEHRQNFVNEWNRRAEEARRAFYRGVKPPLGNTPTTFYPPLGY